MQESTYHAYCAQIDEGARLPALRDTLTRALRERELAAAKLGLHASFEVAEAIGQLKDLLARLDRREGRGSPPPAPPGAGLPLAAQREAQRQAADKQWRATMRATLARTLGHALTQAAMGDMDNVPSHVMQSVASTHARLALLEQGANALGGTQPPALAAAELFAPAILRHVERPTLEQIGQALAAGLAVMEAQREACQAGGQPVPLRLTQALALQQQALAGCREALEHQAGPAPNSAAHSGKPGTFR